MLNSDGTVTINSRVRTKEINRKLTFRSYNEVLVKIRHACGLLAVLLLCAVLVPFPVQADTALEWAVVDKPGDESNTVVTPSEVSEIAIGNSGVFYAIDSENSRIYR